MTSINNTVLLNDRQERMDWVRCRIIENGLTIEELNINYTDDPEDDVIMMLEALNDELQRRNKTFKRLVFPIDL